MILEMLCCKPLYFRAMHFKWIFGFLVFIMISFQSAAQLSVDAWLQDHMVLQREDTIHLSGQSKTGQPVTISFQNNSVDAAVDEYGFWQASFYSGAAGGPFQLTISSGRESIRIKDILIGDVWLCSGQSNMEWKPYQGLEGGEELIKDAHHDRLRLMYVPRNASSIPSNATEGNWMKCTPTNVKRFSAVGYFFGQAVHDSVGVPIGLIDATWGGTRTEYWIEKEALAKLSSWDTLQNKLVAGISGEKLNAFPSSLYNGMIAPLTKMPIKGVLWYQGESNVNEPTSYADFIQSLIQNWRSAWDRELYFFQVQIAPYAYDDLDKANALRSFQSAVALKDPRSGIVITTDVGNWNDIHPLNKYDVGMRLARWALNRVYDQKEIVPSGPVFQSMTVIRHKAFLTFDFMQYDDDDLFLPLVGFEVCGEDSVFYPANAYMKRNSVVVSSPHVRNIHQVRFGYQLQTPPNFFNEVGLPAVPFWATRPEEED